jgi:hypothetical protein
MGAAWQCASQPGPFSLWINEVHYLGDMADATRAAEVVALTAAGVNYAHIDLLLVDANGAVASRRNLAGTCVKTAAGGTWTGAAAAEAWMCDNWVATLDVSASRPPGGERGREENWTGRPAGRGVRSDVELPLTQPVPPFLRAPARRRWAAGWRW